MGKASKKNAQRQQGSGQPRSEFERQRATSLMLAAPDKVTVAEAARAWCDGADPESVAIPRWTNDSVGDRFFSAQTIGDAAEAPLLDGAVLPSGREMAAIRAHWEVATNALVRSVCLDGLPVNDPMVDAVIGSLAPVLEQEVEYWKEAEFSGGIPDETAPLYLLGRNFLVEAAWAIAGDDPLSAVLPLLERRLNAALAALDPAPGFTGTALAWPGARAEARRNLAESGDVTVVIADFETWAPPRPAAFGLVFAATAWHWIDPAVRYRKAWDLLRPGGHLAFWETAAPPVPEISPYEPKTPPASSHDYEDLFFRVIFS